MSVVAELRVSSADLVLDDAMAASPGMTVDLEPFVPTDGERMPFVWADGDGAGTFESAVADDPTVAGVTRLDGFDDGGLFRVEWAETDGGFVDGVRDGDGTLVRAVGRDGE